MTASLQIRAASIRVREPGPTTGQIWLSIDGQDFPREGWDDFVVVVLRGWLDAALRLWGHTNRREIVHFMDGAYRVEVSAVGNGRLGFRALEGSTRLAERAVGQESSLVFMTQAVERAQEVLYVVRRRGCWSPDDEALLASSRELDALLRGSLLPPPHQGGVEP